MERDERERSGDEERKKQVSPFFFHEKKKTKKLFAQINAPYGLTGPHHLVSVTTRADLAYVFVVSATEKQWAKARGTLEKVAKSFQA